MSRGDNIAMDFEMVVKRYLKECDDTAFYAAGIYNTDVFAARAILYTICMKEGYCNTKLYSEEQTEALGRLRERLSDESEGLTAVWDGVEFLKNIRST